jgi:hypothetical protein
LLFTEGMDPKDGLGAEKGDTDSGAKACPDGCQRFIIVWLCCKGGTGGT